MPLNKNMGLGPLGEVAFVHKFRWSLECQDLVGNQILSEMWFEKVCIDFKKNQLKFRAMELVPSKESTDIEIQRWLSEENHKKEALVLTTFDGVGKPIYQYRFFNPSVLEDKMSFQYDSDAVQKRLVTIQFEDYTRTFLANGQENRFEKVNTKYLWKLRIENHPEIEVKLCRRPSLNVHEVPLAHMNVETTVPGKANWDPLEITLPEDHEKSQVLQSLMSGEKTDLCLDLYSASGDRLESWKLIGVHLSKIGSSKDFCPKITVRYSRAEYRTVIANWPLR